MSKADGKIEQALEILELLELPRAQRNERSAAYEQYGRKYAPNTRETFRRQTMHQFVDAGMALYNPDKLDRETNSPKTVYQIEPNALALLRQYGTPKWEAALKSYLKIRPTLSKRYAKERKMKLLPVTFNESETVRLSPGKHSQLVTEIISEFAPRFTPNAQVLYIGDTGNKMVYFDKATLKTLGVEVDKRGKMPDVVLYYKKKNWLVLVEAVTSHGPIDAKRYGELEKLFSKAKQGLVYVTAFPDRSTMARYLAELSWETEVWITESPTHMIHLNGSRFLGPYKSD